MYRLNYIFLLLTLFAMLTACQERTPAYKIGVSQCAGGNWREKVNNEMLAAQHLYEQDVEVSIADAHDDVAVQLRQIDSLAQSGIDLLVVAPSEATTIAEAIDRVRRRGIPVIFFDRRADTDNYTAFIGGDNVEVGRTMGRYTASVARRMEGSPFILEITGAMSTSPAQERHQGFAEVMEEERRTAEQEGKTLEYVTREADWTSEEAYRIVMEQIGSGRLPDIVFCHNDGMATGVYKAVVKTDTEGQIKILGIDGLPGEGLEYVQFGHQIGTYIYPTHGEEIVRLALNILTGQPYERNNVLRGLLVTPENVDMTADLSTDNIRQNDNLTILQDKLVAYLGLYNSQRNVLMACFFAITLLLVAIILMWRAYAQMRRTLRDRQAMNEEETLFYTNADGRRLRQIFEKQEEETQPVRTSDTIFAERLNEAIRQNMSNPSLKMDDLGETVGLGRVQLYRKVKAITGLSPVELLRQMRLQRAYVLLTTTKMTVSEVAYEVGFGTPSYFSKCFKQQFGKYPTDVRS